MASGRYLSAFSALWLCVVPFSAQAVPQDSEGALRYYLAKNRLYLLQGNDEAAKRSLLKAAAIGGKERQEVLVAILNTCLSLYCGPTGWQAAQRLEDNPAYGQNKDVQAQIARWYKAKGRRLHSRVGLAETGAARRETLFHLDGEGQLGDHWRVGAAQDVNQNDLEKVRDAQTGALRDVSQTTLSSELYAEYARGDRYSVRGHLFAGDEGLGLGSTLTRYDYHGALQLTAAWRQPYTDYTELLANGGTRDRVLLTRRQTLSPRWTAELSGGAARYHIGTLEAASGLLVQGGLNYSAAPQTTKALLGESSYITARYGLDGEYIGNTATRVGRDGAAFTPLPLDTREYHSLNLALGKTLTAGLRLEGYGGYVYNRKTSSGAPLFGASAAYPISKTVEVAVETNQSLSNTGGSSGGGDTFTYSGLRLNWLY